jgi:hypothetical protein
VPRARGSCGVNRKKLFYIHELEDIVNIKFWPQGKHLFLNVQLLFAPSFLA